MPTLDLSAVTGLRIGQLHTYRTKEHEARKGDGPDVLEVYYVATIELEEPVLDTCRIGCNVKRTDQKAIGQPINQGEYSDGDDTDRLGVN